jgi:hypothetical protein
MGNLATPGDHTKTDGDSRVPRIIALAASLNWRSLNFAQLKG